MLFNSLIFILFFIWVLLVHYSPLAWRFKKNHLLIASYVFYAAWNPPYILLLMISTWVDWQVAKRMHQQVNSKKRKHWLWLSLTVNLGMLASFKYTGFMADNFTDLMQALGFSVTLADPGLILPVGISFFTFQTLSYTLDVYFKRLEPWHSFRDYALFVSFFPQLVAGPIVRAKDFLPQTQQQSHVPVAVFSLGVSLFIIGLFQKTVLADTFFAPIVDQVFANSTGIDTASAWLGSLFFSAQIFSDFSGYSLCAIGVALCLGFNLPVNFRSPFAAIGFSDLWRRWHISLSSWLRDYLYFPLGGNRHGQWQQYRNLMLTMLLGGLWHGAAWTFVIWGGLHGILLVVEHGLRKTQSYHQLLKTKPFRFVYGLFTFMMVMLAFVIFRADDMTQAGQLITALWPNAQNQSVVEINLWVKFVILAFVLLMLSQIFMRNRHLNHVLQSMPILWRTLMLSLFLLLMLITNGNSNAFIYFQF